MRLPLYCPEKHHDAKWEYSASGVSRVFGNAVRPLKGGRFGTEEFRAHDDRDKPRFCVALGGVLASLVPVKPLKFGGHGKDLMTSTEKFFGTSQTAIVQIFHHMVNDTEGLFEAFRDLSIASKVFIEDR